MGKQKKKLTGGIIQNGLEEEKLEENNSKITGKKVLINRNDNEKSVNNRKFLVDGNTVEFNFEF